MRSRILKYAVYIVPLIVIMVLVLWYGSSNYYPKLYGDEYGYWASGAYFAGLDWDDVTALNDYYGWGYGLILSLFLRLPISTKGSYVLALALNGIMLWVVYLVYFKLTGELFVGKSKPFCAVIAFACTIMPSSLYYTQFTLSEVILEFVYSLLIYEIWLLIKRLYLRRVMLVALLNAWLMAIHLRTIGIVAISVFTVIVLCFCLPGKRLKSLAVFLVVLVLGVIGANWMKSIFQEGVALDFVMLKTGNTAGGQLGKVQQLLSSEGILSFLSNMLGRLFSLFVNSYLLAIVTMIFGLIGLIKGIKKRRIDAVSKFTIICLGNTLSLMAISALYMIGSTGSRFDILTYSRYHEFTTGILILLGLYYFYRNVHHSAANKVMAVSVIGMLVLCKAVSLIMNYDTTPNNLYAHNPRVLFFYRSASNTRSIYILMFILAFTVFMLLYVILKSKSSRLFVCAVCVLIVMNINESKFIFDRGVRSWTNTYFTETEDMVDFITTNDYNQSLCFLADDDVLKIDLLRFAMKNDRIVVVDDEQLSSMMDDGNILITTVTYSGEANLQDYMVVYADNNLYLWSSVNNE